MSISCSHFISNSFFYFQFELQFELFPQILLRKPFVCAFSYQCKQATTKKQKNSKGPEGAWGPPLGHSVFNRCPLATFQSTIGKKIHEKNSTPALEIQKKSWKLHSLCDMINVLGTVGSSNCRNLKFFWNLIGLLSKITRFFCCKGNEKSEKSENLQKAKGSKKSETQILKIRSICIKFFKLLNPLPKKSLFILEKGVFLI